MTCPKCGIVPGGETAERRRSLRPRRPICSIPAKREIRICRRRASRGVRPGAFGEIRDPCSRDAASRRRRDGDPGRPAGLLVLLLGRFRPSGRDRRRSVLRRDGRPQAAALDFLPGSLLQLQGTLFGALLDAIVGGVLGFLSFGSIAFAFGHLANLILALTGGIQFRTGRPEAAAEKEEAKSSERLSLTADQSS